MRQSIILCIGLILGGHISSAQNQAYSYGRHLVDTLCSPTFNGRGYYQDGTNKASRFILHEMERIGLSAQLQPFSFPVNVLDGEVKLYLDKKELIPGKDYLVHAGIPTNKGKAKSYMARATGSEPHDKSLKNKMIVIDPTIASKSEQPLLQQLYEQILQDQSLNYRGAILLTDKLTHRISNTQSVKPGFILKKEVWNRSTKRIKWHVESRLDESYEANNVIGFLEGELQDSFIVVTAHLDHLGQMGHNTMFPGANDNASGVAMMLSLAKQFTDRRIKPKYSLVFIAFSGEEAGLRGSKYFVEHPTMDLNKIKFLINLDILGTGDDGIQVVNGNVYREQFDELVEINEKYQLLKQVKIRGESCNSDHCPFYEKGVPSFFMYTLGGVAHYHDIKDKAETLPLTEFADVKRLLVQFIQGQ